MAQIVIFAAYFVQMHQNPCCQRHPRVTKTKPIDRNHIHTHIIFCAADNIDHHKYNDCKRSYYRIRHLRAEIENLKTAASAYSKVNSTADLLFQSKNTAKNSRTDCPHCHKIFIEYLFRNGIPLREIILYISKR